MSMKKKSSGAAAKRASRSQAPKGNPQGTGPVPGGGSNLTGRAPEMWDQTHGGRALQDAPPKGISAEAGVAEDTGPVVEGTGGGLAFERKPSGTRNTPRKEQPTTPERAEIIEGRWLEREMKKGAVNPATAAGMGAADAAKIGGRVRVLRSAATGWEMGTIVYLAPGGAGGTAELDGGEHVGLEPGRWEPAVGALAAPQLDNRDLKSQGGTIDRAGQDQAANQAEALGTAVKSAQRSAKPARARASRAKSAKKASR